MSASFIAGDWGTTNLRLFLCDAEGTLLDEALGPGARETHGEFARTYDSLTARWAQRFGRLPAILCGMVGSSMGWQQTRYVSCPVEAEQIASSCVDVREGDICIVPGLSCVNRLGAPDLMRGEETQIVGALKLHHELIEGRHLFCAPGTHTKWVVVENGQIREMLTAPAGELFAAIRDHTVLVESRATMDEGAEDVAFRRGISEVARYPHVHLLHRIFECRSRSLMNDLAAGEAASYLSGLLIATDVGGALQMFADIPPGPVHVIGSKDLAHRYGQAFAAAGRETHIMDGAAAARSGLTQLHHLRSRKVS